MRSLPSYAEGCLDGDGGTPAPSESALPGTERPAVSGADALRDLVLKVLQGKREEVPVLSRVALRLRTLMQEPRLHAAEIANLVRNDRALATRVIRLANSAHYAGTDPVSDLVHALRRVGFKAVENIVLATSSRDLYRPLSAAGAEIMAGLWDHALAVATAAKWIARETERADPEDAFLSGLLHDVGRALALRVLGNATARKPQMRRALSPDQMVAIIDAHHAELGGALLEKWTFPPEVVRAAREHHVVQETATDHPLLLLVAVADRVAWMAGLDVGSPEADGLAEYPLARALGLSDATLDSLQSSLAERQQEMKRLLAA